MTQNDLTQLYALGLLGEEGAEIAQLLGKGVRFGIDAKGPGGTNVREQLQSEVGDMLAAVDYAVMAGLLDWRDIEDFRKLKLAKLRDPKATAADGRRLAPAVGEQWNG